MIREPVIGRIVRRVGLAAEPTNSLWKSRKEVLKGLAVGHGNVDSTDTQALRESILVHNYKTHSTKEQPWLFDRRQSLVQESAAARTLSWNHVQTAPPGQ